MSRKRPYSLIQFLNGRENGQSKRLRSSDPDSARLVAEEKATLPVKNQSCELSGQSRATFLMTFSPDGTKIASTHGDHTVRVTDIKTGHCSHILTGHPRTPWCIAFHPSSNDILASGCLAGEVRIWDLRGGGSEVWKSENGSVIASIAFHPTDQVLVIATNNEMLFWDWTRPKPFARCKTASDVEKVRWVKFDPWGHFLYTGISNPNTTPQTEETTAQQVSYIDGPQEELNTVERQRLQQRYRNIVQQISRNQRDRINTSYPPGSSTVGTGSAPQPGDMPPATQPPLPRPPSSTTTGDALSGPHQVELDMMEPHSPVHAEALEDARHYASHVTRHMMGGATTQQPEELASAPPQDILSLAAADHNDDLHGDADAPPGMDLVHHDNLEEETDYFADVIDMVEDAPGASGTPDSAERLTLRIPNPSATAMPTVSMSSAHMVPSVVSASHPQVAPSVVPVAAGGVAAPSPSHVISRTVINSDTPQSAGESASDTSHSAFVPRPQVSLAMILQSHPPGSSTSQPQPSTSSNFGKSDSSSKKSGSLFGSILRTRLSSDDDEHKGDNKNNSDKTEKDSKKAVIVKFPVSSSIRIIPSTSSVTMATSSMLSSTSLSSSRSGSASSSSVTSSSSSNSSSTSSSTSSSSRVSLLRSRLLNQAAQSSPHVSRAAARRSRMIDTSGSRTAESGCPDPCDVCGGSQAGGLTYGRAAADRMASRGQRTARETTVRTGSADSQRLANFIGQEVRSAIDRVRNRQVDINDTLSALNELQADHDVTSSSTTSSTGGRCTPSIVSAMGGRSTTSSDSATGGHCTSSTVSATGGRCASSSASANGGRCSVSSMSTSRGRSSASSGIPTVTIVSSPSAIVSCTPSTTVTMATGVFASSTSSTTVTPSSTSQSGTTPSVSNLSQEIDRRLEHLNQLGRHVSEITQRLGERMRNLNDERQRELTSIRQRMNTQQYYNVSERLRDRHERLRAHLEEIRQRYITGANNSEGDASQDTPATSLAQTERELRDLQGEVGLFSRQGEGRTSPRSPRRSRLRAARHGTDGLSPEVQRRLARHHRRDRTWYAMQRRHLHPHYSVSILDDTINRQNDGLQAAINRAIAGAFMGVGESAVASNIVSVTHRIQRWDFRKFVIPDITDSESNVIVTPCKIHNDASCDISQDGRYLAAFVPSHHGFPDDTILGLFSLLPESLGQCIFTKSFGPNAISVSISPLTNYVLVGLAAKRLAWVFTPKQMVAQIFKLKTAYDGEDSMEHICDLMHPCDLDMRSHISVNSARWLPGTGEGVVYGTNRGDLHICRPGDDEKDVKDRRSSSDNQESSHIRRNLLHMLGLTVPRTTSTATQTVHRIRRSASTQTEVFHHHHHHGHHDGESSRE